MCSFDKRAQIRYGVEVQCPGRLEYDRIVKVCTLPSALQANSSSKTAVPAASAASSRPAITAVAQESAPAARNPVHGGI